MLGSPASRNSIQNITSDPQAGCSNIPKPQRTRSVNRGTTDVTTSRLSRPSGLRQHQSDVALTAAKRQSYAGANSPEDMESIFSEAQALAQRLGGQTARGNGVSTASEAIGRSAIRRDALLASTAPAQSAMPSYRTSVSGDLSGSMLRKPRASLTQVSRLSVPSKLPASSSTPTLKPRAAVPTTPGSKSDSRTNGVALKPREQERDVTSTLRLPGSPTSSSLPTPAARKLTGLQQQSPLARPIVKSNVPDGQTVSALLPNLPISSVSIDESQAILELTEELERWKTEAREHQRERAAIEALRKQITTLERDLEVALDTLQSTEGRLIQTKAEKDEAQPKLASYEKVIQDMKFEIEQEKNHRERSQADEATTRQQLLDDLKTRNEGELINCQCTSHKANVVN